MSGTEGMVMEPDRALVERHNYRPVIVICVDVLCLALASSRVHGIAIIGAALQHLTKRSESMNRLSEK